MKRVLYSLADTTHLIHSGGRLLLAGDESLLAQLPAGDWIGGTIPYFMGESGGEFSKEKICVTQLPEFISKIDIKSYDAESIKDIYNDAPDNGFTFLILPAFSDIHLKFALKVPTFENFAIRHIAGWIAGVKVEDIGCVSPKVFHGKFPGKALENTAISMMIHFPQNKAVETNIINIFEMDDTVEFQFEDNSFKVKEAIINGTKVNFYDYLTEKKINTRLPLIADYCGTLINISFQSLDPVKKEVLLYAPVFKNVTYHLSKPIEDYISKFHQFTQDIDDTNILFSCNCILNYLYSNLQNSTTGHFTGPVTFGEVAYQLLNQTLVYISVYDI